MKSYEKSRLPDPTYDVDGDGVVSTKDLYLASKFDVNGDGVLQEDEVFELRSQMVDDILRVYDDLPHASDTRKIRGIMQEFRDRRDEVIGYPLYEITSSSLNLPTSLPEEPGPLPGLNPL